MRTPELGCRRIGLVMGFEVCPTTLSWKEISVRGGGGTHANRNKLPKGQMGIPNFKMLLSPYTAV